MDNKITEIFIPGPAGRLEAKYFKSKLKQGVKHINMAQILELFGHTPEPHHYKQLFEIADVSEPWEDNNSYYGITHKGIFYPMISDSVH